MGFLLDLVKYIDAQTSLTLDTDLFVGGQYADAPNKAVILQEISPGVESESRMIADPIQVVAKEVSYEASKSLAYVVYDLLAHKPGFTATGLTNVLYCDVLNRPFYLGYDDRGAYLFVFNLLFRRS